LKQKKILFYFQLIISAAFLFSAISKIISPGYFEITLIDQGILPNRELASYFTRIFIIIELAIGLLFLQQNYIKKIISPTAILMLVLFIGHMLLLILQGDNDNCGCFSSVIRMNPPEAIIKNIVLLIITLFIFKFSDIGKNKIALPALMLIISIIIVLITTPIKSTDSSMFSKHTNFSNIGRVDLTDGELLIAVFDANCEHCEETAKAIKRIDDDLDELLPIYTLIFSETKSEISDFQKRTDTNFPFTRINVDEFFDLIGDSPPRIYMLNNGEIVEFWDHKIEEKIWEKFGNSDDSIQNIIVE